MKSYVSILLALLGIALFGIIGGCSSDSNNNVTTTKRDEIVTTYSTTEKRTNSFSETMESLKDDVSDKISEAGSDIKDMLPNKDNGTVAPEKDNR